MLYSVAMELGLRFSILILIYIWDFFSLGLLQIIEFEDFSFLKLDSPYMSSQLFI